MKLTPASNAERDDALRGRRRRCDRRTSSCRGTAPIPRGRCRQDGGIPWLTPEWECSQRHRAAKPSVHATEPASRYNSRLSRSNFASHACLFEDDGAFKAGTVLADNDTSLQVEAASGKRLKIKAAQRAAALRRSRRPAALLAEAQALAEDIDPDVPVGSQRRRRVRVRRSRRRIFRRAPRRPRRRRSRSACTRRRCISTRRARGASKAAPAEALKAALAGVERKRREAEEVAVLAAELLARIACRRRCATSCRCCSTSPTSSARWPRAPWRRRAKRCTPIRWRCWLPAARFHRRTTIISIASCPRHFRAAPRFPTTAGT